MKTVIQIVLWIVIIVLGYFLIIGIQRPIEFTKKKDKRYDATIQRLKDIRKAQKAFKAENGYYTDDFDSLIDFIKTDSLTVVKAIGHVPDTLTEQEAVELKLVIRDTSLISTRDSLFPPPYPIDSLSFVPYTAGKDRFELDTISIETQPGVLVPHLEAKASNKVILQGLDRQEIINLNAAQRKLEKYEGLRIGSLEEVNNLAGNWED